MNLSQIQAFEPGDARLGRQADRRPRPGRGQGGGQPGRHPLAVRRGVRASRRQARARPAVPRRAREPERRCSRRRSPRASTAVRLDPGSGFAADLHRDGRDHRALILARQGQEAGPQVGRPVHRLHRRDRRRRHAARGARRRRGIYAAIGRAIRRTRSSRALRRAEPVRGHDPRDACLARPAVRRSGQPATPAPRASGGSSTRRATFMFPGGMGGGGQLALNQLLVVMDGIDNPPFFRRFFTNWINTLLDAIYIVPREVGKCSLRLPAAEAAQGADLLHRRDQRPDRAARSGADPSGAHGPPRLVPHADQAGPQGHPRPLHRQGRARARARPAEAARRARPHHERLLARR